MSRPERRRESTSTSNFGVGRRESHDASAFYSRFPLPTISEDSEVARPACTDRLWVGDARAMDDYARGDDGRPLIEESSVALVVTSPPYYAGKEYEEAVGQGHIPATYIDYLDMLHDVFEQCVDKLEPGGRIAVNVANLGRRPYRSLSADVIDILQNRLKLLLRGEVIWQKARGATGSCAWGSFQRPGTPVLRDLTERVVIASKGRFDRAQRPAERAEANLPAVGSATADEFMEATTDVWDIRPASATRVGHPAPFPVELPQRLIDLYTYRGDLVLDPFMGAGTTAVAAVRTGRHYVGFDTDADYIDLAQQRIAAEKARLENCSGSQRWEVIVPPTSKGNGRSASLDNPGDLPTPASTEGNDDSADRHCTSGERVDPLRDDTINNGNDADDGARAHVGHSGDQSHAGPHIARTAHLRHNGDSAAVGSKVRAGTEGDHTDDNTAGQDDDFQARAVREGRKARALAEEILVHCGFREIRERVRCLGGVEVNFEASDQSGRRWRFDVSGAFTVTQRPGLRRMDTLWKALGKAAALYFAEQAAGNPVPPPLVLLTTNGPARNSNGRKALAATTGEGKPIRDVIELLDLQDVARLAELARGQPAQPEPEPAGRRSG